MKGIFPHGWIKINFEWIIHCFFNSKNIIFLFNFKLTLFFIDIFNIKRLNNIFLEPEFKLIHLSIQFWENNQLLD